MVMSYHDWLVALNLPGEEEWIIMIMVYKIACAYSLDGIHVDDLFSYSGTTTRSNGYN